MKKNNQRQQRIKLLKTAMGDFIAKHLTDHYTESTLKEYQQQAQWSQQLYDAKIPIVPPIAVNDNYIYQNPQGLWILYPYVNGSTLLANEINTKQLEELTTTLATIHQLQLRPTTITQLPWEIDFKLLNRLLAQETTLLTDLENWLTPVLPELRNNLVISHRDLTPSNVIWIAPGNHYLIDIDWLGPINPAMEAFAFAFDWSWREDGQLDTARWLSILQYYQRLNGPFSLSFNTILAGVIGHWLSWILFNLQGVNSDPATQLHITYSLRAITTVLAQRSHLQRLVAGLEFIAYS